MWFIFRVTDPVSSKIGVIGIKEEVIDSTGCVEEISIVRKDVGDACVTA